jgi:type IV secretion system protein VirB1
VAVESLGSALAINVNSFDSELVHQPRNADEAVAMASWLLAHGYNFDAGLAQVNSSNFSRLGLTPENLFDPCTNLRAGAVVLGECLFLAEARLGEGPQAEEGALSCYNTGSLRRGVENGYVAAVQGATSAPASPGAADRQPEPSRPRVSDPPTLGRRVADVFGERRSP